MAYLNRAIADGYAFITGDEGKQWITYVSSDNHKEKYSDPEEQVRAEFWAELIYEYDYPANRIKIEVTIPDRVPTDRADIVIFSDDECKKPYAVVECKKDGVTDAEFLQAIEQGVGNATSEKTNQVVYEQKQYKNVKTGFTPFQHGDLLWAKITPCMQNGKSFLSDTMPTEFGFGSTEFHVLRQKSERIYMPFLWVLLSDEHILEAAQGMFSGSAGQQRVPDTFLKKFPIILPPIELQKELADEVMEALNQAKKMKEAAESEWADAKAQFEKELLGET